MAETSCWIASSATEFCVEVVILAMSPRLLRFAIAGKRQLPKFAGGRCRIDPFPGGLAIESLTAPSQSLVITVIAGQSTKCTNEPNNGIRTRKVCYGTDIHAVRKSSGEDS